MNKITRREFVKYTIGAGAAASASITIAQPAPFAKIRGANEDIRLGIIGIGSKVKIGGKGKADMRDFRKIPGVRIAALCDPEAAHLDPEVKKCRDINEKVGAYADMREMLDDPNIDAVSITTPNHWHALATIWACQAGKDAFVQKPASHNIFEGRKMIEAARRYKRIVQTTHGPRSTTGMGEAFEYIRQGHLGKILYAHGLNYRSRTSIGKVASAPPIPKTLNYNLWAGPVRNTKPPKRQYLHYDWHWDWDTGNGDLGNMGIHYMDGCRWALGQDTLPKRVITIGGRFGYDDDGETPNTLVTLLDYEPAPLIFEVRGLPRNAALRQSAWKSDDMDSHLNLKIGTIVHCEKGYVVQNKAYDKKGKLLKEFKATNKDTKTNFIEAMRSRKVEDLSSDVLQGHLSAALVHMTNISHRTGKESPPEAIREQVQGEKELQDAYNRMMEHMEANKIDLGKNPLILGTPLTFNPETEQFEGKFSKWANNLATRKYREPFVVPEKI